MAISFANIGLPGSRISRYGRQPNHVLIRQREYEHDVVVATWQGIGSPARKLLKAGAPIRIRFGYWPASSETFVGYVHHKETVQDAGVEPYTKLYCVGASHAMNTAWTATHRYHNVRTRIAFIAKKYGFSVQGHKPKSTGEQVNTQRGRSDWQMIVSLAKEAGLTVNALRTTVLLRKREIATTGRLPLFRHDPIRYRQLGAIHSFKRTHGGVLPGNDSWVDQTYYMNDYGELFPQPVIHRRDVEREFPTFHRFTDWTARSRVEAMRKLKAKADLDKFRVRAQAELSGNAKVRPGETIRLLTEDVAFSGNWWVTGVDHEITAVDYRMTVDVRRETLNPRPRRPIREDWRGRPELPLDVIYEDNYGDDGDGSGSAPESETYPTVPDTVYTPPAIPGVDDSPLPRESPARQMREQQRVGRKPRPLVVDCCVRAPVEPRLNAWRATSTGARR